MNLENVIIESKHLKLIPISLKYKEDVFNEFTAEITVYTGPQPAKDISETENFINESITGIKNGNNMQMIILNKKTGEFLGCAGLHGTNTKTPELGIWIKASAHGHGYGKESMFTLKERADKNLDYEYILYPVERENYASRRIPEALGGKIHREYKSPNAAGKEQDLLEYRIYPNK